MKYFPWELVLMSTLLHVCSCQDYYFQLKKIEYMNIFSWAKAFFCEKALVLLQALALQRFSLKKKYSLETFLAVF